ncbi:MAG: aldehyde dehydrogenase (NADP(+)) [Planctomycetes bacterium]|nr:aldehyde dehydrogenase (NADP(+)) [Planctomycetota bacterium]
MSVQPVLINGVWKASAGTRTFQAVNPATLTALPEVYPVSPWSEIEEAVQAAARAAATVATWPGERFARFLERYAERIDARAAELVALAHQETALPVEPRLSKAELPRTTSQLRQAAAAARDGSWLRPTIDTKANIRAVFGPIGPVVVFGPNNFPFAFNGISGGDFAAAVAAGNPVIAKGHSCHPGTTRLFAVEAQLAAQETDMPAGFIQLIYRTDHADGEKLVSHPQIGAIGYTGARETGLVLKTAADKAGKPIYLELSSINPVFMLPGALAERGAALVDEFASSCLMGTGQFCTNPGLVVLVAGSETDAFVKAVQEKFSAAPVGTLLSEGVQKHLARGIETIRAAGAKLLTGGEPGGGKGASYRNTLLTVSGDQFVADAARLQTEAFGNCSLFVIARDASQLSSIASAMEGNLTGTIYSANDGRDDDLYRTVEPLLRRRVGRLLNDRMPTGVAVSPAMNHGGPFPATGHPGFTAVGIPASVQRFAALYCYDNVRAHRLPASLQDQNPTGKLWRLIDGTWSQAHIG